MWEGSGAFRTFIPLETGEGLGKLMVEITELGREPPNGRWNSLLDREREREKEINHKF